MDITFVTTAENDEQGYALLKGLGMPFQEPRGQARLTVPMAKTSLIIKSQRAPEVQDARAYTRCGICGRPRAVYRKFGICRICLRERALLGEIPGMRKASW